MLRWVVFIYTILTLSHLTIQIALSHREYLRQRRQYALTKEQIAELYARDDLPFVSVVIPTYNEQPERAELMLLSLQMQRYPNLHIYVVNDGPAGGAVSEVYRRLQGESTTVVSLPKQGGKRRAMHRGFELIDQASLNLKLDDEFTVTVDSDTYAENEDSVLNLVYPLLIEPDVAAVTGDVRVANQGTNRLTRLIGRRYWMAFNQERAAQSLFGVMMCCSGPFSAYRTSLLREIQDAFVGQRFCWQECTFGDDRHLTNLILAKGYRTRYNHVARCYTYVPERLFWEYLKQQLRWNKSFYREILWNVRFAHRRHVYMSYELLMQLVLPPMLMFMIVLMIHQAVTVDPWIAVRYGAVIATIGFLRSAYGVYRTKDWGFLGFFVYGFVHVGLLIPVRLVALLTVWHNDWLTRKKRKVKKQGVK